MTDHSALIERLDGEPGDCPFCGRDPYHYVDNGVGMERVAVNCCDEGIAYFQHGDPVLIEQVDLRREAAAAIRDLTEWRDISTAPTQKNVLAWLHLPKNPMASGPVLAHRVYYDGVPHEEDARYRDGCWWANARYYAPEDDGGYITHWLPLPSAPNQAKEAGE